MSVFGLYSRYYDLLYKDKPYSKEADYVDQLIKVHCPGAKSILELGCGTGKHAALFAEKGYAITGIDQSEEMLAIARSRKVKGNAAFLQGDVRTIDVGKAFDVVISLFHVVSYQITNKDLEAVFETARKHLRPGGIFIFDVWYLPAVLTNRPAVRIKRLEDDQMKVRRIAEPVLHAVENVVDVNYEVLIEEKATGKIQVLTELHRMRYLSSPEIDKYINGSGMQTVHSEEWMTGNKPSCDTWGVCFVARKE